MVETDPALGDLLTAVRAKSSTPALEWAEPPIPLTGGFWAEMWRVRFECGPQELSGDLVARVMPDPSIAARESVVQDHLARAGFPTPIVRLEAGPGPHFDRAWMIMDLALGGPMLDDLSGPSALARLPRIARDLPGRLAGHAASLHAIDPDDLTRALGVDDDVGDLLDRLEDRSQMLGRADLEALAQWLRRHRPLSGPRVICHGDLHPFNVLSAPSGDTVLDWSAARVADPAYDLAFTRLLLANPPLVAPRALRPLIDLAGRGLARRFLDAYACRTDRPIDADRLEWFTLLHALRMFTEVALLDGRDEPDQVAGHPLRAMQRPLCAYVAAATRIDPSR